MSYNHWTRAGVMADIGDRDHLRPGRDDAWMDYQRRVREHNYCRVCGRDLATQPREFHKCAGCSRALAPPMIHAMEARRVFEETENLLTSALSPPVATMESHVKTVKRLHRLARLGALLAAAYILLHAAARFFHV